MNEFVENFFKSKIRIKQFCKENNLNLEVFSRYITNLGYIVTPNRTGESIYKIKLAIEYYKNSRRTHSQVAAIYGLNANSFKEELKKLELLDVNRTSRKYNEYALDLIDTEEKAYWLGYIYADGYIYNIKPRANGQIDYNFELCSKGDDIEHMKKFAKFMEYEGEVKETKADNQGHTRCRVCFSSKHLWETLNNYGCTPNKSLTLQFPDKSIFVDSSLIRHFIRGYFDGDGCISFGNKEHTVVTAQVLGTKQFLNSIMDYVHKEYNLYHNHDNVDEGTMQIKISCRQAFNFIKFLYKDSNIYLQRKFDRYCYFCRLYEKSYSETRTEIGESCDANPEVTTETKESVVP